MTGVVTIAAGVALGIVIGLPVAGLLMAAIHMAVETALWGRGGNDG